MAQRQNTRQLLLEAGIQEINDHGVTGFSIRRAAERCGVSCAAPYRHFKDKREFIAAIIEYVNSQWAVRQQEILDQCGQGYRAQIVELSVGYVQFLMDKPHLRAVLMLKDENFDNIYHRTQGQEASRSQQLQHDYFTAAGFDPATRRRKLQLVRAMVFGTVFLFDIGEIPYDQAALADLRHILDREFDLP